MLISILVFSNLITSRCYVTYCQDGLTHIIQCPDENSFKAWKKAFETAASKEQVKVALAKKKQSLGMSIKKNVSGKAATSGAGKGLIKDELGKNGVRVIEIMKAIITVHDGKKKATEVSLVLSFFLPSPLS